MNSQKTLLNNIFTTLEKIEVRGSENIMTMGNLMIFIQQEIKKLEELEKSPDKILTKEK